jgi:hypothetical protein
VIPCQLQKWMEAFHEPKIPWGSLVDSLNLSEAIRSVSLLGALAAVLGCKYSRFVEKRRSNK